jgi:hypothetical protein
VPEVAALIAVPFPFSTPVMVVLTVIAGVVVAVATVPANPFAVVTDTLCTEPGTAAVEAISVTTPELFLKYSLPSLVLIANSPAAKLAASGTAKAVELLYNLIGVNPEAAIFIPCRMTYS